jgi:hypothetical protein
MRPTRRFARLTAALVLVGALVGCSDDPGTAPTRGAAGTVAAVAAADASPSGRAVPDGIRAGDTGISGAAVRRRAVRHRRVGVRGHRRGPRLGRARPDRPGRYEIVSIDAVDGGVTTDVVFRAGSLVENIRYQCTLRDGRIVNLFARYR